jgi:hypothetical protein
MIAGRDWRYGVEAETAPRDLQALARRIELKRRDGEVDGVILLLRSSRRTAAFLAGAGDLLSLNFPIGARQAVSRLAAGEDPGGSAIIVLPAVRAIGFASAGR